MKPKKIRQNKTVSRAFAGLFCIALIMIITAKAYSQGSEPNLRVIISTVSDSSEKEIPTKNSFKVGGAMQIKAEITNLSNEVVEVPEGIVYSRPTLFHNGQLISYRKEAGERFKKGKYITLSKNLLPGKSQSETLNLSDYYESLEPGQYQLYLKRHFFKVGNIDIYIESNAVTFEIIPCDGNSQ